MSRTCLLVTSAIVWSCLPVCKGAEPVVRSPITVHVLDTQRGKPAEGLAVILEQAEGKEWREISKGKTGADGRIETLVPKDKRLPTGVYRLTFDSGAYFAETKTKTFYPRVVIIFEVENLDSHYHVPLIISPFGYSTYRGS